MNFGGRIKTQPGLLGNGGRRSGAGNAARIDQLHAATHFRDVQSIQSMRLHALKGSRTEEWAIYLTGQWRLIVTRGDTEAHMVIQEVSNHYDD